jgi:hypothetical protein
MANGIEFCEGCPRGEVFVKHEVEPALIEIKFSGLGRAIIRAAGIKRNIISITDYENRIGETLIVNDELLEKPGIVKDALKHCSGPIKRICPAEHYLKEGE